jgi:hypothetical protein
MAEHSQTKPSAKCRAINFSAEDEWMAAVSSPVKNKNIFIKLCGTVLMFMVLRRQSRMT